MGPFPISGVFLGFLPLYRRRRRRRRRLSVFHGSLSSEGGSAMWGSGGKWRPPGWEKGHKYFFLRFIFIVYWFLFFGIFLVLIINKSFFNKNFVQFLNFLLFFYLSLVFYVFLKPFLLPFVRLSFKADENENYLILKKVQM